MKNPLQKETCSFICLFQHSLSLEGSSQQPCPMDGTQEQGMRCVLAMLGMRL